MSFLDFVHKAIRKKDKNVKSISAKIEPLVDITAFQDEYELFTYEAMQPKVSKNGEPVEQPQEVEKPFEPAPIDELSAFKYCGQPKVLYRELITTSLLYKAIGKIYKKVCFKERHLFFILSQTLAVNYIRISAHKPLPFTDSF